MYEIDPNDPNWKQKYVTQQQQQQQMNDSLSIYIARI